MRAAVDAAAFAGALNSVSKLIRRSPIPVLEGLLVQFRDGRCLLTGMDDTTRLTLSLPAWGDRFAFVFQRPQAAVRACRYFQGELVLEIHDDLSNYPTMTLTCGHRSGIFDAFREKDYPLTPPLEEYVSFPANAAALLRRVERVKYAVRVPQSLSEQAQRTCVQFSGNDVFCLDGYRAACDTDTTLTFPEPFLIRGDSLSLLKLMGNRGMTVRIGDQHVWFSTGDMTICARKESAEPFKLWNAVPESFSEEFTVSPQEFLRELEYLEGFQPRKPHRPVCFCGGRMVLDKAESKCSTVVEIEGESGIAIGFDPRFMRDALTQFREEPRVRVKLTGAVGPIILEADGRTDFALILPVRLQGLMTA